MKLIDKDQIVAEIEKCYNECLKRAKITDSDYWNAKADAYRNVLVILNDTLEVKDVDLESEMKEVKHNYKVDDNQYASICSADIEWLAEHFFELGLKTDNSVYNKTLKGE